MLQIPVQTLTLDAFLQLPETQPASEFINNQLIQKRYIENRTKFVMIVILAGAEYLSVKAGCRV